MHNNRLDQLRRTLEDSYRLVDAGFPFGEEKIVLARVADIDELIDRITPEQFAVDERIPYWAVPWRSAVALSRHIAAHPEEVAGREVLDMGCGLGLQGIAAAIMGARVTFADYEPHALLFAEYNALRNLPPAAALLSKFELLDWRDKPARQWDVILAADLLYEERSVEPFLAFVERALRGKGLLLNADPGRAVAESFLGRLMAPRFITDTYDMAVSMEKSTARVRIHRICRSGA